MISPNKLERSAVQRKIEDLLSQPARKLHLGCGRKYIPGFFHVDAYGHPNVDVQGPVEKLDFAPDCSIDLIYAAHVLEHFGRHEVDGVLKEWNRVLKPGGVLRLSVPDYVACAKLLIDGRLGRGIDEILGLMVGGQRDAHDYHKMIFDEPSLIARLKAAGFSSTRHWDWRTTEHAGVDDYSQAYLPHMDKEKGTLVSLNVEAIK